MCPNQWSDFPHAYRTKPGSPPSRRTRNNITTCVTNYQERRSCFSSHLYIILSVRPFCLPSPNPGKLIFCSSDRSAPFLRWKIAPVVKVFFFFLKSHLDITSSLLFMFWAFSTPINPLILDCARTQRPLSGLLLFYLTFFLDMPWLHFACLGDRWSVDPPLLHLLSIAFSESSPPAGRNTNKSDQMLWSRISNKNHWTEIFWKEADIKWKLLSRLRNTEKMCGKYDSSLGGTGNISDLERV